MTFQQEILREFLYSQNVIYVFNASGRENVMIFGVKFKCPYIRIFNLLIGLNKFRSEGEIEMKYFVSLKKG